MATINVSIISVAWFGHLTFTLISSSSTLGRNSAEFKFNLISFNLYPQDTDAELLFGGLEGLEIVHDDMGLSYIPQYGINTIGSVDIVNGYHLFISGDDDADDVNSTFLQPFVAYSTKTQTTFTVNSESTYNHEADSGDEWTVPINLTVAQLVKLGDQMTQFLVGYRHYAETPSGGPDYGVRLQMTLLFPKL